MLKKHLLEENLTYQAIAKQYGVDQHQISRLSKDYEIPRNTKTYSMIHVKDLAGKVFGRLTAVKPSGKYIDNKQVWKCYCECGNIVEVVGTSLTQGTTQSCGCLAIERVSETNTKHGMSQERIYNIWNGMMGRCYNQKAKFYNDYGGRGIYVCDEWYDVNNFVEWALVNGYNKKLTIDRIDVNGNYEPDNCRWITNKEQQNNKRNNVFIEYQGETKTLQQWSEILEINHTVIRNRLKRGWSLDRLFEKPKFIRK